jgi:hypothetical protein
MPWFRHLHFLYHLAKDVGGCAVKWLLVCYSPAAHPESVWSRDLLSAYLTCGSPAQGCVKRGGFHDSQAETVVDDIRREFSSCNAATSDKGWNSQRTCELARIPLLSLARWAPLRATEVHGISTDVWPRWNWVGCAHAAGLLGIFQVRRALGRA